MEINCIQFEKGGLRGKVFFWKSTAYNLKSPDDFECDRFDIRAMLAAVISL